MMRRRLLYDFTHNILPNEYRQIEYIQSNGGQYINTNYFPNINTDWTVRFSNFRASGSSVYATPGGVALTNSQIGLYSVNSGGRVFTAFGNKSDITYNSPNTNQWLSETIININKTGVIQNNINMVTYSNVTFGNSPYSMVLFARRNGTSGAIERYVLMNLYESIITEQGNLIQHLLPCIRKIDSKPGLYDLVGRTFYVNQGTGEFTTP